MSAAARLWRRAPAWRGCLMLATVSSAVALLYAPWPAARPAAPAAGRYAPVTREALLGSKHVDTVIVAGRLVPLPSGTWHRIVTDSQREDPQVHSALLVRVRDDRVDGIVLARGTAVASEAARKLPFGQLCDSPRALEARVVPVGGGARECWGLVSTALPAAWRGTHTDALYLGALDALQQADLALPAISMGAAWFRADATDWAVVEYCFEPAADPAAPTQPARWSRKAVAHEPAARDLVRRISRWSERWTPLLERGAAGTLQAAEVVAARSQDDPDTIR